MGSCLPSDIPSDAYARPPQLSPNIRWWPTLSATAPTAVQSNDCIMYENYLMRHTGSLTFAITVDTPVFENTSDLYPSFERSFVRSFARKPLAHMK